MAQTSTVIYGIPFDRFELKRDYCEQIVNMLDPSYKKQFRKFAATAGYDLSKNYDKTIACTQYVLQYKDGKGLEQLLLDLINHNECENRPRFRKYKNFIGINSFYIHKRNKLSLYSEQTISHILKTYIYPLMTVQHNTRYVKARKE